MYNTMVAGPKTRVTVGNQIFEIPAEKVAELFHILNGWQSIAVNEQTPASPMLAYKGQSLIHG
jgi:hypothetical protein